MTIDAIRPVIIIADSFNEKKSVALGTLVGAAQKIRKCYSAPIKLLVITGDDKAMTMNWVRKTGLDGIIIQVPGLTGYHGEIYKTVFSEILREMNAAYICLPHTSWGMELAPTLAIRLNADCITAVVAITGQKGPPLFSRLICNAKRIAKIKSLVDTTVLTVQPGAFSAEKKDAVRQASIELRTMKATPRHIKSDRITPPLAQDTDIGRARVIVAAGSGIEKQEALTLIRQLATCFQKAAVAGSRIVCDRGWLGYGCQVGVTGMTVAPKLYIACGISGAAQHVSGMDTSGTVIAINKDPNAAIFNSADLGIVADLALFIPAFIKICQQGE
jgi:electron transfer flavoprotein alpha subunit